MLVRVQRYPVARPPFRSLFSSEREIDDLFKSFLGSNVTPFVRTYPAIDLAEHEDELVLVAELPGVKKEDVKISLEDKFLTISGVRKASAIPEGSSWVRNEVDTGEFSRSIELPHGVEAGKVSAELENGILRVVLPKPEQIRPREIRVH